MVDLADDRLLPGAGVEPMPSERVTDALERALCDEHARAVVASVSGGMAHHFNNLLSGVLGLVSLAPTLEPAAMASLGDRLKTQIDHASRLIRVVLTLTRRAHEGTTGQCEAVGQARDVIALVAVTASASVSVEADLPADDVLVPLSPVAVDRIILILLLAAAEVTGDEGMIRFALRPVGDRCELVISTTGAAVGAVASSADVLGGASVDRAALSRLTAGRLIEAADGTVEYGADDNGLSCWRVLLPRLCFS